MDRSARPLPNPAVVSRQVDAGEAVLVNLDTAASLALNASGFVVWQHVDGKRTVEEIIAAVQRYYRDVPGTVADDVIALLKILVEDGFIGFEWAPTTSA